MAQREEEPVNFVHHAAINIFDEIWTDCYDRVAARVPGFQRFHCIAIPDGFPRLNLTCGESAIRLAISLVHWRKPDPNNFGWRIGNVTVPQMRRHLQRNGMKDFPIYIAAPPIPGDEDDRVLIPSRGSVHRQDNWAIVYIPDAPHAPHWTFMKVPPPQEEEIPDFVHSVCMVYTAVPHSPEPEQFWRAEVTKDNFTAFMTAKAANRACCCPLEKRCEHEVEFLRLHPNAICLSMLTDRYIRGTYRCQFKPHANVDRLPNNNVRVYHAEEQTTVGKAYGCAAILDIGKMCSPWSMISTALNPRPLDPFQQTEHPLLEIPIDVRDTNFGGMPVTGYSYEPRQSLFNDCQIATSITLGLCAALAGIGRIVDSFMDLFGTKAGQSANAPSVTSGMGMSLIQGDGVRVGCLPLCVPPSCPLASTPFLPDARVMPRVISWLKELACHFACMWKYTRTFSAAACKAAVGIGGLAVGGYLAYTGWRSLRIRLRRTRLVPIVALPKEERFGRLDDLHWNVPSVDELQSRLATLPNITADHAYDILRRIAAMENWKVKWNRSEVLTWITRVVTVPGETRLVYDSPKHKCLNCKIACMKYRMLCKRCWQRLRTERPSRYIPDEFLVYVGVLPIFSSRFSFPAVQMKPGAEVRKHGTVLFNSHSQPQEMLDWYSKQHVLTSYRGRNCGPIFMGQCPTCFPRGQETAVVAFLVRLGGVSPANPVAPWFDHLFAYFDREPIAVIEPESRGQFLKHFKGEKLAKMLEAEANINAGKYALPLKNGVPTCDMKGFTKAEKSYWFTVENDLKISKKHVKPRFICCPQPEFLFTLGPYTHAQTKWLSKQYGPTDHLFYAGCATPEQLNQWLNYVHRALGHYISIADDISACDSSHSEESMKFHRRARMKLFGRLPFDIALHYDAEETLTIKVGEYRLSVNFVNGSGVSDTSFKNSLLCLFIRLFAVAHAVRDLTHMDLAEMFEWLTYIREMVYTAASGDDGMIRCTRFIDGVDLTSPDSIRRYNEMWANFGFTVKVQVFPEEEWRMATFLACRPTWTGNFYEFTPEPARRMRSLFWQIDNSMHPVVWGRSVATSLWNSAAPNPVLGPLARWYLLNTTGGVVETSLFDNPYNPFCGYETVGKEVTTRAIKEFLIDYHLTDRDYEVYLGMLRDSPSVYVSMNCHLIRMLYRLEC